MKLKKLLPLLFILFSFSFTAKANYMLIQNVTKVGNNPTNKTILIQFDISWQNSWRDSINWDAAWVFIKFKDANGLWQHARLNLAGYLNGAGTSNTIKVGSDSVGAFVYRSALGSGNFNATSMQLQWNYGASGLTDVSALEVRVFATEMVYVPEGDFNIAKTFFYMYNAPNGEWDDISGTSSCFGNNFPVINSRMSPNISYSDSTYYDYNSGRFLPFNINVRIKGNNGIDTNNDGITDFPEYPTGFKAFYCYKYELTEQQYADFLNTLTSSQVIALGIAGSGISLINGQYFSSTPNKACGKSNTNRLFSYADWSGLRPLTFLEFNKASYGPQVPILNSYVCCYSQNFPYYPAWNTSNSGPISSEYTLMQLKDVGFYANSSTNRSQSGASYYGIIDLTGNALEPLVSLNSFNYSIKNGNGFIDSLGNSDLPSWNNLFIKYVDQIYFASNYGSNLTNYNF